MQMPVGYLGEFFLCKPRIKFWELTHKNDSPSHVMGLLDSTVKLSVCECITLHITFLYFYAHPGVNKPSSLGQGLKRASRPKACAAADRPLMRP